MLRNILSVTAGVVLWSVLWVAGNAVLSLATPGSFKEDGSTDLFAILAGILVWSIVLSILSGYVTVAIARSQGLVQTVIVGAILLAIGIFVQMQYWDVMPLWYHLSFLVLLLPMVVVGGKIRLARTG
jgi:hypothetical protein